MRPKTDRRRAAGLLLLLLAAGCGDGADGAAGAAGGGGDGPGGGRRWRTVTDGAGGALMSVWGRSAADVYVVGGDPGIGTGPAAFHLAGGLWQAVPTAGVSGPLHWVFGPDGDAEDGPVWMVGAGGTILRHDPAARDTIREEADPPLSAGVDLWGVWGRSPASLWAVGGEGGRGLVLRRGGDGVWAPDPDGPPAQALDGRTLFKAWGDDGDAGDAWVVGSGGAVLRRNASGWREVPLPAGVSPSASLLTAHGDTVVGGAAAAVLLTWAADGASLVAPPIPSPQPNLNGVRVAPGGLGEAVAVGAFGTILARDGAGTWTAEPDPPTDWDLHAVWVDERGDTWVAGGDLTGPGGLSGAGVLAHHGAVLPPRLFRGP